jgi:hypothetical protein
MNVLITCCCYGLSKPSSLSSTHGWCKPITLMAVREEKMGGDPRISPPSCWGCSWESFFLGSNGIHPNLLVTHERLLYTDYARYVWLRTICGPRVKSVWRVG